MHKTSQRDQRATTRAIIDIGSNTIRLVIYGGPARAAEVLHNEKVTARLGKAVSESGLLGDRASDNALQALARFRTLLALKGVEQIDVVATAAVRDARNGPAFLDRVRDLGFSPRLLSGEEEAVTSAHGVIGAFPGATGVVGDLGGGSLELVDIDGQNCRHGVSMPLGTLRLPALRSEGDRAFARAIGKALERADYGAAPGTALYLVGGSLRAFARYAMTGCHWPIDDPHGYEMAPADAVRVAKALARRKVETLAPLPGLSNSRLASLPDTAALLAELVRQLQPGRLVFSAWGLREGLLYQEMPAAVRGQDPLVTGVSSFVRHQGLSAQSGALVAGWTLAARGSVAGDGTFANAIGLHAPVTRLEHLRLCATMLCLAAATIEPNLRGDIAREWALRKRWIGAGTYERAMLAVAMLANTGRTAIPGELTALLPPASVHQAIGWGLATRLCRRFSGATAVGLSGSVLEVEGDVLRLSVDEPLAVLVNDAVERDLKTLGSHLGLRHEVRRGSLPG